MGPESPAGYRYVYQVAVCDNIDRPLTPQCAGNNVCQYMNVGNEYLFLSPTSSWSTRPLPTWSYINPANPAEGLVVSAQNGGICGSSGYNRQTNIYLNCTTSATAPSLKVHFQHP
jgi:hypothetical protein